jgi:hypothetical protein
MRRGLISRSPAELPDDVLAARVARTQAAMAGAGLDALLLYSNNTRPAAASWLCGFVPYWSEGAMVLPKGADPYLVVALTKRVATWIAATSKVASVISTPRFGQEAGRMIAAAGGSSVGVADLDSLPAGILDELRGTGVTVTDATALFARLRGIADPAETALAARAATIAHNALACLVPEHDEASEIIAAVEGRARAFAAEECYVAISPDLARGQKFLRLEGDTAIGRSYAVRATVAYKGTWVRTVRTMFRDPLRAPIAREAATRFAHAVAQLPGAQGFAGLPSWLVEGCRVAQPLEALMGTRIAEPRPPAPGALVSVQASIEQDGEPVLLGGPALLGAAGEPAALLVPPVFREGD